MQKIYKAYYNSPIGIVEIRGTEDGIQSIVFVDNEVEREDCPTFMEECIVQLDEYFKGKRKEFSLTLLPEGTTFQKSVWKELEKIPYGNTKSYKDIAVSIGNEKAVRAIGSTNGRNPISIVVPCHRVIGANGKLTGYAGGLWRKEWLLCHEEKFSKVSNRYIKLE
jgi:methylated-DNA-[protein]-cysteine S-methyltransferase